MESARVLVHMICALAALKLAAATETVILWVIYPNPTQLNYVKLVCSDGIRQLPHAVFMKDGAPLTSGPASDQVTIRRSENGRVLFYFSQAQEGFFSCVHNNHASQKIGIAGIRNKYM